jgi:hypothetical protein
MRKSFIVTLEGEEADVDSLDLFAHISGTWEGVSVTVEAAPPAAQPKPGCIPLDDYAAEVYEERSKRLR